MTRNDVLLEACNGCIKKLYSFVTPSISWEEFVSECKTYSNKYKIWENYNKAFKERITKPEIWVQYKSTFKDWENKSIEECIGPKPYEFYYLSEDIIKDIVDSYIYAYKIDSHQKFLDTIELLKNYCKDPIIDKYIEKEGEFGYREYDHPDNLEKEIENILFGRMSEEPGEYREESAKILQDKFFEFLDMAGKFYNLDGELSSFNMSIYLGASPNPNKEAVIENWKKYRNQDIEINEEQIKKEYYGENE